MTAEKIKTCYKMIYIIMSIIAFIGTGFASTVVYSEYIKMLLGSMMLQIVVSIELITIAFLMLSILRKIVIIEKLNMEER